MSSWQSESGYITRYVGGGALNTLAGFAVIFALMTLGVSPLVANIGGYLVGFTLGFLVSKTFVFRSNGHFVAESFRYLLAFFACFMMNIATLQVSLTAFHIDEYLAQLLSAVAYTASMYGFARCFVFRSDRASQRES
jgi:putative flippase GtrA